MWGYTLVETSHATIAQRVFQCWADLMALGPAKLDLRGNYTFSIPEVDLGPGESMTALEAGYEHLEFDRDTTVSALQQIADWCEQISREAGRLYLLHLGI